MGRGVGWWVVSGSGKGMENLMGLWYWEIKIQHFYQYEYQQLSLSVLLIILPLNSCYYFIFPQKCKSVLYFLHLLG